MPTGREHWLVGWEEMSQCTGKQRKKGTWGQVIKDFKGLLEVLYFLFWACSSSGVLLPTEGDFEVEKTGAQGPKEKTRKLMKSYYLNQHILNYSSEYWCSSWCWLMFSSGRELFTGKTSLRIVLCLALPWRMTMHPNYDNPVLKKSF